LSSRACAPIGPQQRENRLTTTPPGLDLRQHPY
jgi:hypothetical protein